MKRMPLLMFCAAWLIAAHPVSQTVKVAGQSYRVSVAGRTVKVFSKALFAKQSPEIEEAMRAAARTVTGCELKNVYWRAAHIEGLADCTSRDSTSAVTN